MKSVFIILLLVVSNVLSAQDIPKKANTIIITENMSRDAYFKIVTSILFESGYGIGQSDQAAGTITTSPKPMRAGTVSLMLYVQDKKVLIRGNLTGPDIEGTGISLKDPQRIEYSGMKGSLIRNAWDEMYKFSSQIPGKKEYLVK